ncbi:hypothetical protein GA830_00075 [Mesorhizobium sp. NBSH29]|nr:hypothetical protein GA830_00075 [Mesorhizobium sp. NBSH29]
MKNDFLDYRQMEAATMFQAIFERILTAVLQKRSPGLTANPDQTCTGWRRDPLAHPVIAEMSLVELADLPARSLRACRE